MIDHDHSEEKSRSAKQHGALIPAILDGLRSNAAIATLTGSNTRGRAAIDNFRVPFSRACSGRSDVASSLLNDVG